MFSVYNINMFTYTEGTCKYLKFDFICGRFTHTLQSFTDISWSFIGHIFCIETLNAIRFQLLAHKVARADFYYFSEIVLKRSLSWYNILEGIYIYIYSLRWSMSLTEFEETM